MSTDAAGSPVAELLAYRESVMQIIFERKAFCSSVVVSKLGGADVGYPLSFVQ